MPKNALKTTATIATQKKNQTINLKNLKLGNILNNYQKQ